MRRRHNCQGDSEDFDCFFRCVLALGKESEALTFDETAGNILLLCARATSDLFRCELRLKGRALTLENIQELADDNRKAEKEEQDMNALRDENIRVIGKGGARPRNSQPSRNPNQTAEKTPCNRCGKSNHQTSECTFPRSVKCVKCGKTEHIGPACCGGKPPGQVNNRLTNQGRARQVAPREQDEVTQANTQEAAQTVSAARTSPAFYV